MAKMLDSWHIACTSPALSISAGGDVPRSRVGLVVSCGTMGNVWLIFNTSGFEYTNDLMQAEAALDTLFPSIGMAGTQMTLSMIGQSFTRMTTCCIGDSLQPNDAVVVTSSLLLCRVHAKDAGLLSVRASSSACLDQQYVSMPFLTVPRVSVLGIFPASAIEAVTATVTVFGSGFANTRQLSCAFGNTGIVSAQFVTSSLLICSVPSGRTRNATLEVTSDGSHFTSEGLRFAVLPRTEAWEAEPSSGPSSGGCPIVVRTTAALPGDVMGCRFGDVGVQAESAAARSVTCRSPRVEAGEHLISLVLADGSTVGSVPYVSIELPQVSELQPDHGAVGGGTVVTLLGSGFFSSRGLSLHFGASLAADVLDLISSTMMICSSPAHEAGAVPVRFTACSSMEEPSASAVTFRYVPGWLISAVSPLSLIHI